MNCNEPPTRNSATTLHNLKEKEERKTLKLKKNVLNLEQTFL